MLVEGMLSKGNPSYTSQKSFWFWAFKRQMAPILQEKGALMYPFDNSGFKLIDASWFSYY